MCIHVRVSATASGREWFINSYAPKPPFYIISRSFRYALRHIISLSSISLIPLMYYGMIVYSASVYILE